MFDPGLQSLKVQSQGRYHQSYCLPCRDIRTHVVFFSLFSVILMFLCVLLLDIFNEVNRLSQETMGLCNGECCARSKKKCLRFVFYVDL